MRRLTQLFVNRPPLVFVTLAMVLLAGAYAYATLVQQNFPNVDNPTVTVSASYPGAPPSEIRDAIVKPLEDAIAGAPDLDHLNTTIQQNSATITASFSLDSNSTTDLTEVQDRVQIARSALPSDLAAPSARTGAQGLANTVMTLSLTSRSLDAADLSALVINRIVPQLEQVTGVANVGANGTVQSAIEVTVDPNSLASHALTLDDVVAAIQANNVRAPGGLVYSANRETSVDVRGDVQTPASVASLLVAPSTGVLLGATSPSGTVNQKYTGTSGALNQALTLSGASQSASPASTAVNPFSAMPRLVRIGDVATVSDHFEVKRVYGYADGRAAITLQVQRAPGQSEVTVAHAVEAMLPAMETQYPAVRFDLVRVEADISEQQLFGVFQTLLEGVAFTGIAMLFFLRSWRNALVVMVAIPTSLLLTLFVMKLLNLSIDGVSLLAMTLTIGILVDDSIVVLENVDRHHRDGEAPRTAAILGRSEIATAAVVITLVDVVVFLPLSFLPGQPGRILSEFGIVVVVATLASLAVSFTITPSLAGNWSLLSRWRAPKIIDAFTRGFARSRDWYVERALPAALRRPRTVFAACALLTLGALALIPLHVVGFEFLPAQDRGQVFVQVQYPIGTPLTQTDATVRELTDRYLELPDVARITSVSGAYQAGFGSQINLGSVGQIMVSLKTDRRHSTDEIARTLSTIGRRFGNGARVIAIPATGSRGGNGQPIDATISTTRGEPDQYADAIMTALEDTPGTANVNTSALRLAPQIDVEFNRDRARALDVDIGSAAQAVRAAFAGTLATQFDTENGTKYVQVVYPASAQTSRRTLESISVRAANGSIVHLGDIAELKNAPAQAVITRINRQTVIHLGANVLPGYALSKVQAAFMARVRALHLPNTVLVGSAAGGEQQNLALSVKGLGISLLLSLALVYLLMVALYDAYRAPFVIMFAVPVAAVGALGSLALTGQSLNLYSLIGSVMLVGLVSKNGILLVDFARHHVRAGLDKATAIRLAARERFRPIVMTTASMIAGMAPLALALDAGSGFKRSLGTVVIGGLTSSLVLTLVLVPVMFLWIAPGPPRKRPVLGPPQPAGRVPLAVETR